MRLRLAVLAGAALLVAAGDSAAKYAPAKASGDAGYTELKLASDRYAIAYRGGSRDNGKRVAESAMLRAAELTLEHGYEWFLVTRTHSQRVDSGAVDMLNRADTSVRDSSAGAYSSPGGQADPMRAATNGVSVDDAGGQPINPALLEGRRRRQVYETMLEVRMGRGREVAVENPAQEQQIFDAAAVARDLGGRLK